MIKPRRHAGHTPIWMGLAILLLLALLAACATSPDSPAAERSGLSPDDITETDWGLVALGHPDDLQPALEGWSYPTLTFDAELARGTTGCNDYAADYTRDGMALTFGEIEQTAQDCPTAAALEQETRFTALLADVQYFTLTDDRLILAASDGVLMLEADTSAAEQATATAPPAAEQATATVPPVTVTPESASAAPTVVPTIEQRTPTLSPPATEPPTPPAAPVADPAGYLLYSLQAEPEGEAPHREFWRTTLDGSDRLRLLALPPNQGFKGLAVAPDGMQFAYVVEQIRAERNDLTNLDRLRLLQLDTAVGRSDFLGMSNGSADAPLDEGVLTLWPNAFSPDGSQFVFVRPSETNPTPPIPAALWVTEASRGAVPRRVTADYSNISQHAWLDDETLIFSRANRSNVFTLNIRESSALIPEVLVDGGFEALSPDRTRLLVRPEPLVTKKPDQPVPYALISLAGDTPEVLHEWQIPPGKFVWSPDGTMLAQSDYAGALRVLHLEDGTTEELLRVDPGENVSLRAWSADSRSLIYTRDIRDGTGGVIMPRELYRLNVADATSQLIISGDSYDFRRVLVVPPQPGQEP